MTHPTDGEILKICDTEAGSINLSCGLCQKGRNDIRLRLPTYRDLLLRQDHGTVLPSHPDRCDICSGDSLEGIFYMEIVVLAGSAGVIDG